MPSRVTRFFPKADMTYQIDCKRQRFVDTWPADVDDGTAGRDWRINPHYDFERAFPEYLISAIRQRYQ